MAGALGKLLVEIGASTARLERDLAQARKQVDGALGQMTRSLGAFRNVAGGILGGIGFTALAKDIWDASVAFERMENALKAATGSSTAAMQELAFVSDEAKRLGLDLGLAGSGFAQLAASAKGTGVTTAQVRDIFTAVAEASTVLGLSAEDSAGAIRAISQVMSKGKVQAEELRGQLGERIPGAFNVAARAMGVTGTQLSKMLEQGEVYSDEFLPRFAAELRRTYQNALPDALNAAQAELGRMTTSWLELKDTVGEAGFMDAAVGGIKTLTESMDGLTWAIKDVNGALKDESGFWSWLTGTGKDIAVNAMGPVQIGKVMDLLRDYGKYRDLVEKNADQAGIRFPITDQPPAETSIPESAQELIAKLEIERDQLSMAAAEIRVYNELKKAGVSANSAAGQEIAALVRSIEAEKDATEKAKDAAKQRAAEYDKISAAIDRMGEAMRHADTDRLEQSLSTASEEFAHLAGNLRLGVSAMDEITAGLTLYDASATGAADATENLGEKGQTVFSEMETAISGWASNFSAELTDAFWSADFSFSRIAESFGRMLTQMVIQKQIVEPLLGALNFDWGGGGGGGGNYSADVGSLSGSYGLSGARANGGPVGAGRSYLIGEEGPEVLTMGNVAGFVSPIQENGAEVTVQVINNGSGQARVERGEGPDGRELIRVVIDEVDGAIGSGRFDRTFRQTYGLNRQGANR